MAEIPKIDHRILSSEGSFHAVLDEQALAAEKKAVFALAHPDDEALAEGLNVALARKGVGIILVSFTDGGGRKMRNFTQEQLAAQRRREGVDSGIKSGAAMFTTLVYPDGELQRHEDDASESFAGLLDVVKPDFVIATHHLDPHPDHSAANRIARRAMSGRLPFYSMDTVHMRDKHGSLILPTHTFFVSAEDKLVRDEAYLLHESQVKDLPPDEMRDVQAVLDLPGKRGKMVGLPYAGVLVQDLNGRIDDPVGEMLSEDLIRVT